MKPLLGNKRLWACRDVMYWIAGPQVLITTEVCTYYGLAVSASLKAQMQAGHG